MEQHRKGRKRTGRLLAIMALGGLATAGYAVCRSPSTPVASTSPCTHGLVDPERLKTHVRTLSETFAPRDHRHPENLDRTAEYISDALTRAGGRVYSEPYMVGQTRYQNVIATFGPESGERLVIGAHYDAAEGAPGADDNASGVAGLLELAVLLGSRPPAMRVDLVGFTLEEPPHFRQPTMGSKVHARGLRAMGEKVRAMISLESLGYFSDEPDSQQYPVAALKWSHPSRGQFIAVVGRGDEQALITTVHDALRTQEGLASESLAAPRSLTGVDFSDHASFWDEGYPAVLVTDTALFRNPGYHTAEDTWDRLDYARMALTVQGVQCAVQALTPRR